MKNRYAELSFIMLACVLPVSGCNNDSNSTEPSDSRSYFESDEMNVAFHTTSGGQCEISAEKISPSDMTALVKEYTYREMPDFNPEFELETNEIVIADLWKNLGIQVFAVKHLADDGTEQEDEPFLYHNGEIFPFACVLGGFGLMSGHVDDEQFYFTYSWGSGVHRSHLAMIKLVDCEIQMIDSGGFLDVDLFVNKTSDGIVLETGQYNMFNSWNDPKAFGKVVVIDEIEITLTSETEELIDADFNADYNDSVFSCF